MYAFWCSVDNGDGGEKKLTCLQINWFGQEASKEELCVVKQACGAAEMSQQKQHHGHKDDHEAVKSKRSYQHTFKYTCPPRILKTPHFQNFTQTT